MTGPVNCCSPQDEIQALLAAGRQGLRQIERKRRLEKFEGVGIEVRPPVARRLYRVGDAAAVFGGMPCGVGIGSVDVERRHGLRQRGGEGAAAEIELGTTRAAVRSAPAARRSARPPSPRAWPLGRVRGGGALPGKRRIAAREMLLAARIDRRPVSRLANS